MPFKRSKSILYLVENPVCVHLPTICRVIVFLNYNARYDQIVGQIPFSCQLITLSWFVPSLKSSQLLIFQKLIDIPLPQKQLWHSLFSLFSITPMIKTKILMRFLSKQCNGFTRLQYCPVWHLIMINSRLWGIRINFDSAETYLVRICVVYWTIIQ